MKTSSGPKRVTEHRREQNEVILSWHERAHAYHQLIERWPIFTNMANRLLDYLPDDFNGHALDIAGGSGLVAKRLLEIFPDAQVTLVEPAENMRILAHRNLGSQIDILNSTSDDLKKHSLSANAALCNASFHLMNEETTLPSVAGVLKKGSVFIVNCWGHSFKEAKALNRKIDWMNFIDQALGERNLPLMNCPLKTTPNIKSTQDLEIIGKRCGLRLVEADIVTTEIETQFNIEFAAMSSNFLNEIENDIRQQIIDRAITLCKGVDRISSADFCFEKV